MKTLKLCYFISHCYTRRTDMKTLPALLLIILCSPQYVRSLPVFEIMAVKLNDFTKSFMTAFKTIENKIIYFLRNQLKKRNTTLRAINPYTIEEKMRSVFSNILEDSAKNGVTKSFKLEPKVFMTTPQLAKRHGKRIESHVVTTQDGYLLTIHRLVKTLDQPFTGKLLNSTVILHHGLLGSSADWILLGPKKSLPYILSNLGYDVWMTNARGNYYSRGHITKNLNSLEYWKFSWQEMGKYDLSAVVDYIREFKNSNNTIDFIGHSMGATALLVLLSTTPSYNKYFRIGILLAPLAYMANVEGPLRIIAPISMNLPEYILKILGRGEFFSSRKIPSWIVKKYCTGVTFYCSNPLLFLSGSIPRPDSWNSSLVANIMYHLPAGGSTNTILHYAHLVETGKFQKFAEKTEFPLQKVTLPIALFSSSDDWLATIPDVWQLYFSIPNPIDHYIIRGKNFSHTEFVFGLDADILIFNKLTAILARDLSNTITKQNEV